MIAIAYHFCCNLSLVPVRVYNTNEIAGGGGVRGTNGANNRWRPWWLNNKPGNGRGGNRKYPWTSGRRRIMAGGLSLNLDRASVHEDMAFRERMRQNAARSKDKY